MAKTLIIPVAGRSSRFPGMRPKWLLTMPDGKLMIEKSIEGLDLLIFDKILIICLREHVEKYISFDFLDEMKASINHNDVDFCILDTPTKSQSETVAKALTEKNIKGSFLIKDCDNTFSFNWGGGNQIATVNLNNVGIINASNKSYVKIDSLGNVVNIVEKKVISDSFCCGAYGFASADEFLEYFNRIKTDGEVFISHVIFSMLMDGINFTIGNTEGYSDWGTLTEYRDYQKSCMTIFCDVDGVLLENGSKFGPRKWMTEPIIDNVEKLVELQKKGKIYLIVTSARPYDQEGYIRDKLLDFGLVVDRFILNLPHGKRILINDYSATNGYPSAISINIERDSNKLSDFLDPVFG